MRIRGVALDTYYRQIDGGDAEPVHPEVIKITDQHVPVTIGFETDTRVGTTTTLWKENGQIMFEADIDDDNLMRLMRADNPLSARVRLKDHHTAAIGYTLEVKDRDGRLIKGGNIYELGLTGQNANRNQPVWTEIDEDENAEYDAWIAERTYEE